jgi:peptidoglycan/xylan/chitin deacetylase (PgdA/CDA1 family)
VPTFAVAGIALVHTAPAAALVSRPLRRRLGMLDRTASRSAVALTFDDGPHPHGTPAVLAALARAGARATFFLSGEQARRYPQIVRELVDAGHEIGVHGFGHRLPALVGPRRATRDLEDGVAAIAELSGEAPRWYRPPYGAASTPALLAARRAGLRTVLWSRWCRDWEQTASTDSVLERATRDISGGEIVLLHDADHYAHAGSWQVTAAALPAILARIASAGLATGTLGELA